MLRIERPRTRSRAISSRSAKERYRPDGGLAEDLNIDGGMPPAFRNNLAPTGCDMPAINCIIIARFSLYIGKALEPTPNARPHGAIRACNPSDNALFI